MLKELRARWKQGHRTLAWPEGPLPELPERFRGHPVFAENTCAEGCGDCAEACPTGAIQTKPLRIDLGKCLFCGDCAAACRQGVISFGKDYRLAARDRADLQVDHQNKVVLARKLDAKLASLFGRSLKLRQVSAGGCNACESEVNVLGTIVWDIGRFGIQIVASPRHADGLIVTGPVTENMKLALRKTYDAVAPPKIVIAVGACAIAGGPYIGHPEQNGGIGGIVPVDLYIPGCPPHPLTLLDGLLRLLGRIEEGGSRRQGPAIP